MGALISKQRKSKTVMRKSKTVTRKSKTVMRKAKMRGGSLGERNIPIGAVIANPMKTDIGTVDDI